MKTKKRNLLLHAPVAALMGVVLAGGVVLAVNSPGTVTTSSPIVTPPDPQATTTIEQRIAQRKAAAKPQQTAARAAQIASKCSLAQTAVGQLRTKDTKARVARNQAYTTLATRLNNIVINLGNQGFNASELFAKQKQLNDAINKYLATAMDYKTAVDDLVNMDCKSDPAGFEATLSLVRSHRAQLASDGAAIKAQLKPLIDTLNTVKHSLNNKGSNS
jgi:hypothetical protein